MITFYFLSFLAIAVLISDLVYKSFHFLRNSEYKSWDITKKYIRDNIKMFEIVTFQKGNYVYKNIPVTRMEYYSFDLYETIRINPNRIEDKI